MDENNNIQLFGFTEMYEWAENYDFKKRVSRFVTFDKNLTNKIVFAHDDDEILGVTSVCTVSNSDDPDEWKYKYLCNEFGDLYLKKERLAVGREEYDQQLELNYIRTFPWEHFIKIENSSFDKDKEYVKRTNRSEWIRVNLLGKVIVQDNGKCKPGTYCTVYSGKIKDLWGTAVPCEENPSNKKFYVLERFSENTILILNK